MASNFFFLLRALHLANASPCGSNRNEIDEAPRRWHSVQDAYVVHAEEQVRMLGLRCRPSWGETSPICG